MRFSTAPVKEPFSWPNRMLSTRFSGIAPQLTVTKGLDLRPLSPWMARAISSLPTPDSPSISTGMVELAARWPSSSTRCHGLAAGDQVGEAELAAGGGLHADQLVGQRLDLERILDGDFEPLRAHRLDHEVDGAGPHRRNGGVDAAMSGLHDGRRLARQRAHGGENGQAVGARHDEVEQDKADLSRGVGLERGERLVAAIRRGDAIAEPLDGLFENTTLSRVVVDDQIRAWA